MSVLSVMHDAQDSC
jgi:hypothetical protein